MAMDESDAEAAARRFYDAIEDMVAGRGLEAMQAAWHHTDRVSSKHPSGEWAHGWDEVWATWQVFSAFGRADRAGSQLVSIRARVVGDLAYTTGIFRASPAWGQESMMCTNVLQRIDGQWKVVHHHADPSPGMATALERMLEE